MKKIVFCKQCRESIHLKTKALDRVELSMKIGRTFSLKCNSCNSNNMYSVNDVKATASKFFDLLFLIMLIVSGIIGYILFVHYWNTSIYLFYVIPMAVAIPGLIFFKLSKVQNQKISSFNSFYL